MAAILNSAILGFRHFAQNNLHLFILTQFDDGSHLEFCHVVFIHLSFSCQTHSHLLRLVPPLAQKNFTHTSLPTICIKNFTHSFWLNLMMVAIVNFFILDSSILVFPVKLTHTWLDWSHHWNKKHFTHTSLPTICRKNFTYSFWLNLMMAAILKSAIMDSAIVHKKNFTHSFWLNLMMAAILNSAMLYSAILVFPVKLTHTCLDWSHHWHKKNFTHTSPPHHLHKKLHSFILTQFDDGSYLEFFHLGFIHLSFSCQTHSHLIRLVPPLATKNTSLTVPSPPFAQKTSLYSFWLNLMMAAILNSAMLYSATAILDSDTLLSSLRFTQKHSPSTLTLTETNSIWLKIIHSNWTSWWEPSCILPLWILPSWDSGILHKTLTQTHSFWLNLMMAAILNSAILNSAILDSAILVFPLKLAHTFQDWCPPFAQKKSFTHSFWLNLMMAAILNSALLDSATAILDSDTLLSSLRFTQKHSPSILTGTGNWFNLTQNHSF